MRLRPTRIFSIAPSRSGDSSEANGRLPSSLRSCEPRIGFSACSTRSSRARGEIHPQRIDHPVAGEGIDLEPALVGRQHLLLVHVEVAHPLVDPDGGLGEGQPPVDAGLAVLARGSGYRLAEAGDDRLLGFRDDDDRR